MRMIAKVSGAAVLAAGMIWAQTPDPAQSTMPSSSTMQDRNNAAPGSMQRNSTMERQSANGMQQVTGYLVNASCSNLAAASMQGTSTVRDASSMPRQSMSGTSDMPMKSSTAKGDMVNRSSVADATNGARTSSNDPTTAAMTQPDRSTRGMRTDTRASATEMANSENMIEDQVTGAGRRTGDMKASAMAFSKPPSACSANLSTTQFAVFSNGKVYTFDAASNSNFQQQYQQNEKMKMALSNGDTKPVMVTVSASVMDSNTLHVMKIRRGN